MKVWTLALISLVSGSAAERATVIGVVTDKDGKPVEHASVLIYSAGVRKGYSIFCPTCWVDCGKRSQTDAEGKYTITGLDPELVFRLLVVRDGYRSEFVASVDPEKGPAKTATLEPRISPEDPTQVVRGKVVDVHGKPVRDALIEQQGVIYRVNGQQRRSFGPIDWIDQMAVTNDTGEFEIAFGKPAEAMILSVSPRGMASKLFTEPTGGERKILTVTDGATIRGRLVRDGKPVAGAEIGLSTHSRGAGTTLNEIRVGTREDGTFAMTNVPAGRIYYLYGKMNSLADRGLAAELVECETKDDGQEVDVGDVHVKAGYTLRGRVVLSDGKPIPPDMRVNLFHDRATDSQSVLLSADGRFEIKGLAAGVYSLAPSVRSYETPEGQINEVLVQHDVDGVVFTLKPAAPRK
jgi:hypothetical protein